MLMILLFCYMTESWNTHVLKECIIVEVRKVNTVLLKHIDDFATSLNKCVHHMVDTKQILLLKYINGITNRKAFILRSCWFIGCGVFFIAKQFNSSFGIRHQWLFSSDQLIVAAGCGFYIGFESVVFFIGQQQ